MKKKVLMSLVLFTIAGAGMVFAQADMLKFTAVSGGYSVAGISSGKTRGEVSIPETYDGKSVVAIAVKAFENYGGLTGISIPKSVKKISDNAFRGTGITSITIPSSVTEIGANAFENCYSLTQITMGDGVTKIGTNAFRNCSKLRELKSANIGKSVVSIGDSAFEGCRELRRVWIRESVKSINNGAFRDCNNLERVNFQSASTTVGANSFPGDLADRFKEGGKGPYDGVRKGGVHTWTKAKE